MEVLGFRLTRNGYPITVGSVSSLLKAEKGGADGRKIDSRAGLSELFNDMAGNRDSPLVVGIAYFLRTQKQRAAPSG